MRQTFIFLAALLMFALTGYANAQCAPTGVRDVRVGALSTGDVWVYWWCLTPYELQFSWRGVLKENITPGLVADATAYSLGMLPEFANRPPTVPPGHPTMEPLRLAVIEAVGLDPTRPAQPRWAVSKNSGATTRPAYRMTDGVRQKISDSRIAVSTPCDCRVRSVEAGATYCQVAPAVVSLCTRAPR